MSKRRNRTIRNVSEKVDEVKETATDVFVQYGSVEVKAKDIVAKIKNLYSESGKNVDDIDTLKVYIKPEENVAYYVINEEEKGSVSL